MTFFDYFTAFLVGFLIYKWIKSSVASKEYQKRFRSITQLNTMRMLERETRTPTELTVSHIMREAHKNAEAKGFFDPPVPFSVELMSIVSELSECQDADKLGRTAEKVVEGGITQMAYFEGRVLSGSSEFRRAFEIYVKDHKEAELADAVIRICMLAKREGIDLDKYIRWVMLYNLDRPHKHGKAY